MARSRASSGLPPSRSTSTPIRLPCTYPPTWPLLSMTSKRRTAMFSPTLMIKSCRLSSSVRPSAERAISASTLAGCLSSTTSADALGKRAEVFVLGDEVGFGVDLDEDMAPSLFVALEHDSAFGRDARSLLVGFRLALLAEQLGRVVDVAAGVDQRLLAIHHPRAGTLAELLDQSRFDLHRRSLLFYSMSAAARVGRRGFGCC